MRLLPSLKEKGIRPHDNYKHCTAGSLELKKNVPRNSIEFLTFDTPKKWFETFESQKEYDEFINRYRT